MKQKTWKLEGGISNKKCGFRGAFVLAGIPDNKHNWNCHMKKNMAKCEKKGCPGRKKTQKELNKKFMKGWKKSKTYKDFEKILKKWRKRDRKGGKENDSKNN